MKCSTIKTIIYSIFFFIQIFGFSITIILKNDFNYTISSKIFLNIYVLFILSLLVSHILFPKKLKTFLSNNFGIFESYTGQGFISLMIGLIYITSHNVPQVIFSLYSICIGGIIELIELSKNKINKNQIRNTTESNLNLTNESKRMNCRTLDIRIDEIKSNKL